VGEADKVVVFLTRELGKLRGMAKGARRPKSRFGGSLEVGTEVELTFFEKESQDLIRVDRCDIVRSNFSNLGEPLVACTLAYFADLVDQFAPEREANPKLYRLMNAAIGALAVGGDPEKTARYYEAWLLRLAGFYPRKRNCSECGRRLSEVGARYFPVEHRLSCGRCGPGGISISVETMEFLDRIWREPPGSLADPAGKHVLGELAVLHQKLIQEQIDKELSSHQILQDMVRQERKK
jgi:DNA repair protein RecO (recombination protein O)